jgi:hypothetical protein
MYISADVDVDVELCQCVCVCVFPNMCVRAYISTCVYNYDYVKACARVHMYTQEDVHSICVNVCVCIFECVYDED